MSYKIYIFRLQIDSDSEYYFARSLNLPRFPFILNIL